MNKFVSPRWFIINKVISGSYPEYNELLKELSALRKKIEKKRSEHLKEAGTKKELADVAILKSLPVDSVVYYTGFDARIALKAGKKVKDGRKYITVSIEGTVWSIPYKNIQANSLDDKQIDHIQSNVKLRKIFGSEAFNNFRK